MTCTFSVAPSGVSLWQSGVAVGRNSKSGWFQYRVEHPEDEVPTLRKLEREGFVSEDALLCPAFTVLDCNYVLVRENVGSADPNTVVMYEPKANHGGVGGHVVFSDGRVKFLEGDEYDTVTGLLPVEPP